MAFQKATRVQRTPKIALSSPSGGGKTLSALMIAKGYLEGTGKRIAVIDTENHSASLYAERFDFDALALEPPFSVDKYIEAIHEAELAGYGFLIVDSITHEWHYILKSVEAEQGFGGNKFTAWGKWTPKHEAFKDAIIQSHLPIICTMRAKQEYALEKGDNGKNTVTKLGMGSIQRDDTQFEFDAVLMISMDHVAKSDKDRTGLFDGRITTLNEDVGKMLRKWFASAPAASNGPHSPVTTKGQPESSLGTMSPMPGRGEERFVNTPLPHQDDVNDIVLRGIAKEDQAHGLRKAMEAVGAEPESIQTIRQLLNDAGKTGIDEMRRVFKAHQKQWKADHTPEEFTLIQNIAKVIAEGLDKIPYPSGEDDVQI